MKWGNLRVFFMLQWLETVHPQMDLKLLYIVNGMALTLEDCFFFGRGGQGSIPHFFLGTASHFKIILNC
jgi:hypothetical protein